MQLRAQDDRTALSVMSQSPSGDGLFRSDWGPLDVLALRYLYGTKPADTGNTHYALGALRGGSQTTIVDDGGVDTLDASALNTGVSLDLTPGHLGSAGITPAGFSGVDNLGVSASTVIEHAVGSPFDDVLLGNDIDNTLVVASAMTGAKAAPAPTPPRSRGAAPTTRCPTSSARSS